MLIRKLRNDETELLKEFLYEAIFIPEGVEPPDTWRQWYCSQENKALKEDDSSCGARFVKICVADRHHLLWNVGANCVRPHKPPLSQYGKLIDNEILKLNVDI